MLHSKVKTKGNALRCSERKRTLQRRGRSCGDGWEQLERNSKGMHRQAVTKSVNYLKNKLTEEGVPQRRGRQNLGGTINYMQTSIETQHIMVLRAPSGLRWCHQKLAWPTWIPLCPFLTPSLLCLHLLFKSTRGNQLLIFAVLCLWLVLLVALSYLAPLEHAVIRAVWEPLCFFLEQWPHGMVGHQVEANCIQGIASKPRQANNYV